MAVKRKKAHGPQTRKSRDAPTKPQKRRYPCWYPASVRFFISHPTTAPVDERYRKTGVLDTGFLTMP